MSRSVNRFEDSTHLHTSSGRRAAVVCRIGTQRAVQTAGESL